MNLYAKYKTEYAKDDRIGQVKMHLGPRNIKVKTKTSIDSNLSQTHVCSLPT